MKEQPKFKIVHPFCPKCTELDEECPTCREEWLRLDHERGIFWKSLKEFREISWQFNYGKHLRAKEETDTELFPELLITQDSFDKAREKLDRDYCVYRDAARKHRAYHEMLRREYQESKNEEHNEERNQG